MDLRIFTEPQQGASYDDLLRIARATEDLGFDAFFRSDHYLAFGSDGTPGPTDAWVTLGALARETSTIRLGTLVTSATFRYPGPLAISVAQVDLMSGGRIEFGIGAGWYAEEHAAYAIPFPETPERFDRLEETLAIVTGLWATAPGDAYSFTGKHFTVVDSPGLPKPHQSPHPPVIIGGMGKRRTPELAVRFGNEFNIPFRSVADSAAQFSRVRAACEAAGREPGSLTYSNALTVCCGSDEPELARRAAAIGTDLSDLRANALAGTPDEIVDRLGQYAEAGCERRLPPSPRPRRSGSFGAACRESAPPGVSPHSHPSRVVLIGGPVLDSELRNVLISALNPHPGRTARVTAPRHRRTRPHARTRRIGLIAAPVLIVSSAATAVAISGSGGEDGTAPTASPERFEATISTRTAQKLAVSRSETGGRIILDGTDPSRPPRRRHLGDVCHHQPECLVRPGRAVPAPYRARRRRQARHHRPRGRQVDADRLPRQVRMGQRRVRRAHQKPEPIEETADAKSGDSPATSSTVTEAPCRLGSGVESGLTPDAIRVYRSVCAAFPEVTSYGGVRPDSGEHGTGQALDIMSTGSLGDAIAAYVRANASKLGVSEVLWAQEIWTVERSGEGWRSFSDRGSATANHFDHVHVTVYGSSGG